MRNISLVVAYDGTNYHGWQCQPNAVTVQEVLNSAIEKILDHPVKLYAGARTDAGVHAMAQVVNLHTAKPIGLDGLTRGLNSLLPRDIRVRQGLEVAENFHARYSARKKTYVYAILNDRHGSPFLTRYALHVPQGLDLEAMQRAGLCAVGSHDFSAFKKKEEHYENPVRRVDRVVVGKRRQVVLVIVEANGFLRYMVRNIVGTLILVGQGRLSAEGFREILESGERERAGPTAPPHGLFLRKIDY